MTNLNSSDSNDSMAGAYIPISSEIGFENVIIDELMAIPQAVEASKEYFLVTKMHYFQATR